MVEALLIVAQIVFAASYACPVRSCVTIALVRRACIICRLTAGRGSTSPRAITRYCGQVSPRIDIVHFSRSSRSDQKALALCSVLAIASALTPLIPSDSDYVSGQASSLVHELSVAFLGSIALWLLVCLTSWTWYHCVSFHCS
jgi:hypothetical protein